MANFWCATSPLFRWKETLARESAVRLCMGATLLGCMPSCVQVYKYPTHAGFLYTLCTCALSFFLFSFQVKKHVCVTRFLVVCTIHYLYFLQQSEIHDKLSDFHL